MKRTVSTRKGFQARRSEVRRKFEADLNYMSKRKRIVVGISGASGIVYGVRLLEMLRDAGIESHLVISKGAEMTRSYETDLTAEDLRSLADVVYPLGDVGAAISSGSFGTMGMVVIPCSIRTMSEIAAGTTGNLLTRAADVVLKERRRLLLVVRETPLHLGHLRSMVAATEAGAIIAPPVPAFYNRPKTLDDIVNHTVGRVLDLFEIESNAVKRWGEKSNGENRFNTELPEPDSQGEIYLNGKASVL